MLVAAAEMEISPYRLPLDSRRRRLAVFSLFYLCEGLPIGFTAVALAAFLRMQGSSSAEVGAIVAASHAPWAFKWAWAPLVDLFWMERLGRSRSWIILCQLIMIGTLATIFALDLTKQTSLLITLIIIHNIFAATQDVAIDAMAVRALPPDEIGAANGAMFGSQYVGRALGGSGAMLVSAWAGFHAALLFVLVSLGLILFGVTIPLLEQRSGVSVGGDSLLRSLTKRLATFFMELREGVFRSGRGPLVGAVFAVFPSGAMALSLAVGTTMQVDLKLSESAIAAISFFNNAGAGLGALAGGWISDRFGNPRACIAASYVLTGVTTLFLSFQWGEIGANGFATALVAYSVFYGFQYGAASGMYMRLSNPAVAATQFTAFMALGNLPAVYSSAWQGAYVDAHGYAPTLMLDAALACAGLVVLYWVTPYRTRSAKPVAITA